MMYMNYIILSTNFTQSEIMEGEIIVAQALTPSMGANQLCMLIQQDNPVLPFLCCTQHVTFDYPFRTVLSLNQMQLLNSSTYGIEFS